MLTSPRPLGDKLSRKKSILPGCFGRTNCQNRALGTGQAVLSKPKLCFTEEIRRPQQRSLNEARFVERNNEL